MNRKPMTAAALLVMLSACGPSAEPPPAPAAAAPSADSAAPAAVPALSEKEKARTEPYANDTGPAALTPEQLKAYGPELRAGYDLLVVRCAQCHTPARPLNSEFIEADVWKRYVKRMMAKPGCNIAPAEGKKIWTFLVEDSKARKTGANAAAWKAHRQALLDDFKVKHPERYRLLYGAKPKG